MHTGKKGEEMAVAFLKEKKYIILALNWRSKHGEIDIICQQDKTIVFVEVKTRTNTKFGYPEEAVSAHKQKMMIQTADAFLETLHSYEAIRYDIIAIRMNRNKKPEVYHIQDAFFGLEW